MQKFSNIKGTFMKTSILSLIAVFVFSYSLNSNADTLNYDQESNRTAIVEQSQTKITKKSKNIDYKLLVGKWVGKYVCAQGLTNVEMNINENLESDFRFFADSPTQSEFDGYFNGKIIVKRGLISFTPFQNRIEGWSIKPSDGDYWVTIGFKAKLEESGTQISGRVQNSNCSIIGLSKSQ
jgi:hypothetical protein